MSVINAITVDVEDYFHTEAMASVISRAEWDGMPSRVERNTERLFHLFAQHGTQATFFFLGWVAERYPGLVRQAVSYGHEVACHSFWHRAVFRLTRDEFYEDTKRAKLLIEDEAQVPVSGYRAPCFSITPAVPWAFDTLEELGFEYDSSVNPVHHDFYSNRNAPRHPYTVGSGNLVEFPIATWPVAGTNVPVGGGAYLRLFPLTMFRNGLRHINDVEASPAMLYLHPWEIDPEQPRL